MALTRKLLRSMNIEDEKIEQIIEAHAETVDALKGERDELRESAKELEKAKERLAELEGKPDDGYKERFEKLESDFEAYKGEVQAKETTRNKKAAYRKLVLEAGIDPKRIDSIMKLADVSELEMEDGAIKGAEEVKKRIAEEWADFVVQTSKKGAEVDEHKPNEGVTPEQFEKMSLKERNDLYNNDRETYNRLTGRESE